MQRRIGLAICLFCLLLVLGACGERKTGPAAQSDAPVYKVTDIRGYTTQLAAKPQRILTLSLGTDEILLGLVEPERIAAVNQLLLASLTVGTILETIAIGILVGSS